MFKLDLHKEVPL